MQPILFPLGGPHLNVNPVGRRGVPPNFCGVFPLPAVKLLISGVTKDSAGAALGNCVVALYRTQDDQMFERGTSDASGNYSFSAVGLSETYYIVAYKAGSPDVAGTTVNTLTGA